MRMPFGTDSNRPRGATPCCAKRARAASQTAATVSVRRIVRRYSHSPRLRGCAAPMPWRVLISRAIGRPSAAATVW